MVGPSVNLGVDFGNVYDMTLAALWVLTLVVAFAGALVRGKSPGGN
ncbi:MAG: hypothetical protein KGI38_03230 [Thaumarchaeota archaeon]|nr:hypothetical protein [Nitrososphaerota archaeon]